MGNPYTYSENTVHVKASILRYYIYVGFFQKESKKNYKKIKKIFLIALKYSSNRLSNSVARHMSNNTMLTRKYSGNNIFLSPVFPFFFYSEDYARMYNNIEYILKYFHSRLSAYIHVDDHNNSAVY